MSDPKAEKDPNVEKEPGPQGEISSSGTPSSDVPEKKKREYKDFGHDSEKPTRMSIHFTIALGLFSLIYAPRPDANVDMSQVCILAVFLTGLD
jgi:hypothetical protein